MAVRYEVDLTDVAEKSIKKIPDRRQQKAILDKLEYLQEEPVAIGKPLAKALAGYMSVRAGRYRVIYEVDPSKKKVIIHLAGKRKEGDRTDVYVMAKKLLKAKLL